jgi:hypothetical protein
MNKLTKLRNPVIFEQGTGDSALEAAILVNKLDDEIKEKNPELFGGKIEDYPTLPKPELKEGESMVTEIALKPKPIEVTIAYEGEIEPDFWQEAKELNVTVTAQDNGELRLFGAINDINKLLKLEGENTVENSEFYDQ